jgi:hypothetical protein
VRGLVPGSQSETRPSCGVEGEIGTLPTSFFARGRHERRTRRMTSTGRGCSGSIGVNTPRAASPTAVARVAWYCVARIEDSVEDVESTFVADPPGESRSFETQHGSRIAIAGAPIAAAIVVPAGVSLVVAIKLELQSRKALRPDSAYFAKEFSQIVGRMLLGTTHNFARVSDGTT